jgi:hypothetical protein
MMIFYQKKIELAITISLHTLFSFCFTFRRTAPMTPPTFMKAASFGVEKTSTTQETMAMLF